jgi:arsenate reductase (thioredoxin)
MKKALFLCTGNSCRSQMAEAIVNAAYPAVWSAFSAGTKPAGYVHPKAIAVLEEIGIQHQGVSKNVAEFQGEHFDLVVTVCDSAAEDCPVWLGSGRKLHISFPDPDDATGTEEEIMAVFREVRDDIRQKILTTLQEFEE